MSDTDKTDEQIKVIIMDTNAYFMQYVCVILDHNGIPVAQFRAGTQRGLGTKLERHLVKLGYVKP